MNDVTINVVRERAQARLSQLEAEILEVRAGLKLLEQLAGPASSRPTAAKSTATKRKPHGAMTLERARETRRLLSEGLTQTEIARRFGVSPQTIADIAHRRTWKDGTGATAR